MPVAAVSRLHTAVPMAISLVRCHLSLKWPKGSPTTAYIQINTVPKNPSAVSLRRNSLRIGSPNDPSSWQSKKFSKLMANKTKSANFAPATAWFNVAPVLPAGGTPSSVSGLTDIEDSPQDRRLTGTLVCRTSAPAGQFSTERSSRRGHLRPEAANLAARIAFHLGRRTEDHGRARLGVESRPGWDARVVGIPTPRECDPARGELVGHARRIVALARFAERAGYVESMHGTIAAAKGRRGPFPLIHIDGGL